MSFSSKTKNKLSRLEIENDSCALAELSALVRMSGDVEVSNNNDICLKFSTENAAIARRIFSLLKLLYEYHTDVMVRKNKQLKKNNSYFITIDDSNNAKKILKDTGVLASSTNTFKVMNYEVPQHIIRKRSCKRAYIRGAFLGGGSLSDPEKTYHLEFVTHNEIHGSDLKRIINSFNLSSKIVIRKEKYVIYIKEGEQIVDLLNIIGAYSSLLKIENIRVLKEVRNNVNRIVNCETANLSKTINAAIRQINNINYIDSIKGLQSLPDNLREVAELRLKYKEASLKELGQMLTPKVGKSGVNHRLRKIERIAEELKMERGET